MTQDFTDEHRTKLIAYLETHDLPSGLGDEHGACTLAAIRLAYDGQLNDEVIDCMSPVLGKAAMRLQDVMPDEMRNSARYKALIPNMPGTGRELEAERLAVLMDWMWTVVLPQLQPIADNGGFGAEWRDMCETKTPDAAKTAAYAADAARTAAGAGAAADYAADYAAADAADYAAARRTFWEAVDPIGVLERMTYLEMNNAE